MNNSIKKVLLMGPISPPFTGQSVSFTSVVNYFQQNSDVHVINISNKETISSGVILCFKIIFTVLDRSFDVIYFTSSRTFFGSIRDIVLIYSAKIKGVKVINHLHGSDFKSFFYELPLWYKNILFRAYSYIDSSIVLIDGMEEQYDLFPKMKKIVVKNCYNKNLDILPFTKEKKNDHLNLLYLSNIIKTKGIFELLNACKEIFFRFDNINLTIAGEIQGDSTSTLNETKIKFYSMIESLNMEFPYRIKYIGVCKGEQKINLLWNSDVFILPTYYKTEAFPISILEAMRSGNYIISTNFKYIPKIISNANGQLIEPKSSNSIVEAVEKILKNIVNLSIIQNQNIEFAINNYKEDKFISQISNIILE